MAKQKVLIDAKVLSSTPSGIARYLNQILIELSESEYEIILASNAPLVAPHKFVGKYKTVTSNFTSEIGRMFWSSIILPIIIYKLKPDIFWGVAHRIPWFVPKGIRKLLTVHDLVAFEMPETMRFRGFLLNRLMMPNSIKRADHIICVSQATANSLRVFFPSAAEKTTVIHLGGNHFTLPSNRELKKCSISKKTNAKEPQFLEKKYFLSVGTFEPRKNIEGLIRAFALLPSKLRSDHPLIFVGSNGWGGVSPESLAKQYGVSDNVFVLRSISDHQLYNFYTKAYATVFVSHMEGFGLPLVESYWADVPCITSDHSSMREISASSNMLVNPRDYSEIANLMLRLISDYEFYQAELEHVREHKLRYVWKETAQKTKAVFERLLDQPA